MTRWSYLPGLALTIVAALLLGFLANLVLMGRLQHARDQKVAYADVRKEFANATAPVGPVDEGGRLLALGRPVAVLQIPQLGLREVVFEGTTAGVLASGPGHRRDTVLPGQSGTSVIMGRRAAFGGPFADLTGLIRGDVFQVYTGQGPTAHDYRVLGVRFAGDPAPPALTAGQGRLTLLTADGPAFFPSGLVRVDAELISRVQPTPRRAVTPAMLAGSEKALAGDPDEWIGIVLFGQALLLIAGAMMWARMRWGRRQAWLAGAPILIGLGIAVADRAAYLLPNLM
ncbi:LPXTG-site transpeptidase (sortase) family protein [Allocatelliglobosispora scoriae]|uniref:LPXTG-site transpeptidase (Sortase) family protein n=1 Tax=Allocatelliglobosispora scoriae TaxID=643052 RepID=A0A841BSZ7_9ACTN|nr:sortase [Allocatelliglobosispora scoriae]MBB5869910.1 LPXTG-site transpeptidase (sortase) family protein [Allocatelliglobosispora scoriae]